MRRALFVLAMVLSLWAIRSVFADENMFDTVVLCCSEPMPELKTIFADEDLGRVAVVRNMGNVIPVHLVLNPNEPEPEQNVETGSIEYAVLHGAKRVIVLGHKGCDVVRSVIKSLIEGSKPRGNQPAIYAVISKSFTKVRGGWDNLDVMLQKTIEHNVRNTVEELLGNRFVLHKLVESGNLKVVGAVYDPETGKVETLE